MTPENLDDMAPETLRDYCAQALELAKTGDMTALKLANYATRALDARRLRLAGEIVLALREERACELIYRSLPPAMRW